MQDLFLELIGNRAKFQLPFVLLLCLPIMQVLAASGGVSRQSAFGCGPGGCHGPTASSQTSARIKEEEYGRLSFEPNEKRKLTLIINNNNRPAVGCNISVKTTKGGYTNAGTLSTIQGQGLRLLIGELTHDFQPKAMAYGEVQFEFEWTAPPSAGTYFLHAAVNAVNMNGIADGNDQWQVMQAVEITVSPTNSVFEQNSSNQAQITPLPAHEQVSIHALVGGDEAVDLRIFDISGNIVKVASIRPMNNNVDFLWNGTDDADRPLPSGLYPFNIVAPEAVIRGIILFER
ncbi:MAG: hypothetical protein HYX66_04900 [Ignavibacteria bacterium]|nr:hypothetical protein [Ignavibacteria bacterium]